jgi:murein DD-endopeptidase
MCPPRLLSKESKGLGKIRIGAGALLACLAVAYWSQSPGKSDPPAHGPELTHIHLPVPGQDAALANHCDEVATRAPERSPTPVAKPRLLQEVTDTQPDAQPDTAAAQAETIHYQIKPGDTLEEIFKSTQLSIQDLYSILETDEPYLAIDVLKPGDELTFELDADKQLQKLSLEIDPSKTVAYTRNADNSFTYGETNMPFTWISTVLHGRVTDSFYLSARRAGVDETSVMKIAHLLGSKINFQRDLRAGDRFDVVISTRRVNGTGFGMPRVDAIQINVRKRKVNAFLFSDGNYYDDAGDSLTPALRRYPFSGHHRISSNFNPRRLNPVTHRICPHNGVDFAEPIGTPVLSTGDGIVTRVGRHRYAGNYIVIDHDGPYATRYLHLSRILVHKGQRVERGQKIALSGNTGRSTGPHLHFELHIKNRPVNPITAKIPTLKSVPQQEMAEYHRQVESMEQLLSADETQVVQNSSRVAPPKPGNDDSRG